MKTLFFILISFAAFAQQLNLIVELNEMPILTSYSEYDTGGNTSVMNDKVSTLKWSGESPFLHGGHGYFNKNGEEVPYYKRSRDLGQTFAVLGKETMRLEGLVLKTGYGSSPVRTNIYGREIALQFFEVEGQATINNNGTTGQQNARHGFPHSGNIPAERDDYLEGEHYKSIGIKRGFYFPDAEEFGVDGTNEAAEQLKGRLLHFDFSTEPVELLAGKTYAFLVMVVEPCIDCGFTLANKYNGSYTAGHGIRREGNGRFPPPPAKPELHYSHRKNEKALLSSQLPLNFYRRTHISPGTNGYPDVDTYRDLFFYLVGK